MEPKEIKIRGRYQYNEMLDKLTRQGYEILKSGKYAKDEIKHGYTHFIEYIEKQ